MKKILYFILVLPFVGGVVASLLNFNKQEIYKFQKIMTILECIYLGLLILIIIYITVYHIKIIEKKNIENYFSINIKKERKETIETILVYLATVIFLSIDLYRN